MVGLKGIGERGGVDRRFPVIRARPYSRTLVPGAFQGIDLPGTAQAGVNEHLGDLVSIEISILLAVVREQLTATSL